MEPRLAYRLRKLRKVSLNFHNRHSWRAGRLRPELQRRAAPGARAARRCGRRRRSIRRPSRRVSRGSIISSIWKRLSGPIGPRTLSMRALISARSAAGSAASASWRLYAASMPPSGGMPPTSAAGQATRTERRRPGRRVVVAGDAEASTHQHREDRHGHLGEGDHPLAALADRAGDLVLDADREARIVDEVRAPAGGRGRTGRGGGAACRSRRRSARRRSRGGCRTR